MGPESGREADRGAGGAAAGIGRLREIVFDCEHPARAARVWAALLDGYALRPYDAAEVARLAALGRTPETDPVVMLDGPGPTLCFHEMPPGGPGAGRRSPIHLDLAVASRGAAVAAALALGAVRVREGDGYVVMADPEGHRFCLVGPP